MMFVIGSRGVGTDVKIWLLTESLIEPLLYEYKTHTAVPSF